MSMNSSGGHVLDLDQVWGPMSAGGDAAALGSAALQEDLEVSTSEVLTAHGIDATAERTIGGLTIASVIGFSGAGLAGALGLATTDEVLAALYQQSLSNPGDQERYSDWLRELSNQVLGRLKGRLLARGYAIHLALPQSMRGMCLVPNDTRRSSIAWTVMSAEQGPMLAWLDLEQVEGLAREAGPPVQVQPSGEVIIF